MPRQQQQPPNGYKPTMAGWYNVATRHTIPYPQVPAAEVARLRSESVQRRVARGGPASFGTAFLKPVLVDSAL